MPRSCNIVSQSGKLRAGAEHTQDSASGRHVSAALSCPYSVRFRGWDRLSARTAAQRNLCVHPHPHPDALNTLKGGHQKLIPEPEIMANPKAGSLGAHVRAYIPRHYLRRLAYSLASKATRRAELRARAFAVVLADHREGGAA